MQTFDDQALKDSLFDDALFRQMCLHWGVDMMYDAISDLREDLVFQLTSREGQDSWRRKVTALVIRAKRRIRELEQG